MIKEVYVSFEVAKLLKEKRFNEPCHKIYIDGEDEIKGTFNTYMEETMTNKDCEDDEDIVAPTHQMTLAWLRERNIFLNIYPMSLGWYFEVYDLTQLDISGAKPIYAIGIPPKTSVLSSYEEATEAGIKYIFENLI